MADRGALYCVWGKDPKVERALTRSIASLKQHHPELPVEVCRADATDPVHGLIEKARMFELSPFKETLFLDADTVVLGRLDFGFEKARTFGLACSICECPWARRYGGIEGDAIEYNTGVIFFTEAAKPVFDAWQRLAPEVDSSIKFVDPKGQIATMPFNDQASFARALDELELVPYVLPLNWNFRPIWQRSFFGPIRIWHDYSDVPSEVCRLADHYRKKDAIIQFHAFR